MNTGRTNNKVTTIAAGSCADLWSKPSKSFTGSIRPKVTNGLAVWWSAVEKVTNAMKLAVLQRLACFGITEAMGKALSILLGLKKFPKWLKREALASCSRIESRGKWINSQSERDHMKFAAGYPNPGCENDITGIPLKVGKIF